MSILLFFLSKSILRCNVCSDNGSFFSFLSKSFQDLELFENMSNAFLLHSV
uniref:Uncharacterized protein n=1 Tax=Rhizophora mucronata TaxID=61149 RepID=A0A2P2PXU7_RHIMU